MAWARWFVAALLVMPISVSCGDTAPSELRSGERPTETASPKWSKPEASMTPDLRAAYVAAVQADAGEMYHAEQDGAGSARFVHLSQGFEATLDGAEVRVTPQRGATAWELSLTTSSVGCEGAPERGLDAGAVAIAGNRVEITRGDVRERYVNGPLGLEQGFPWSARRPVRGRRS